MSEERIKPTKEQFQAWMKNQVTEYFFDELALDRQEIMESWANGAFTAETAEATVQLNAKALGQIDMIDQTFETLAILAGDDEDERPDGEEPYSS